MLLHKLAACAGVTCGLSDCCCKRACDCWCWIAAVLAFIKAFSIARVTSGEKTGLVSIDPGTGSFQVLSIPSIALRVGLSTSVYASIKVL